MDKRRGKLNLRRSARSLTSASSSAARSSAAGARKAKVPAPTDPPNYSLQWNLQSQHILNELAKLYYGQQEEGPEVADVSLFSSEGDCVQAHKVLLMLCSPYFQKLFVQVSKGQQRKERDGAIVVLGNVRTLQLQHLVRFLYTGQVEVTNAKDLEEFQKIAKQFGIEGVSRLAGGREGRGGGVKSSPSTVSAKTRVSSSSLKYKVIYKPSKAPAPPDEELDSSFPLSSEDGGGGDLGGDHRVDTEKSQEQHGGETGGDLEAVVKTEPLDEVILEDDVTGPGGDEDDFLGGSALEDDAGSNFSDELGGDLGGELDDDDDDYSKDPEVSFDTKGQMKLTNSLKKRKEGTAAVQRRRKLKAPGGGPTQLNWRTGKLTGWHRISPLTDEELQKDWRKLNFIQGKGCQTKLFYCPYGGKKCPQVLKIKTLMDGTDLYFKNAYEHANHRGPDDCFGLSAEQKRLVIQCVESGITQPINILYKMEDAGVPKPQKLKLNNMLARLKKKEGYRHYWVKREPKWPRRIRKKPEKDGPPKKRGRPSKSGDEGGSGGGSGGNGSRYAASIYHHPPVQPAPPPPPQQEPLKLAVEPGGRSPPGDGGGGGSQSSSPIPMSSGGGGGAFQPHPNHFLGQSLALAAAFPFHPNPPGGGGGHSVPPQPPHYHFDNYR